MSLVQNKYLKAKKNIYKSIKENSIKEQNELEIYPSDEDKKDKLEAKIKKELTTEFSVMFQKMTFSKEDEEQVTQFIKDYIKKNKYFFKSPQDYHLFVSQIVNEIFGLGVLEQYINDETITEIWILGAKKIYFEQYGKRHESPLKFKNDNIIISMINKILAPINRKADESNPTVDARLQDGSRVAITLPPIALGGPEIVIRKFKKDKFMLDQYVEFHSMTRQMQEFLQTSVKWGANILVVGGTGSGKTTLLNALTSEIPRNEKTKEYEHVITIEDSAELIVDNPFLQGWETRNKNSEGKGLISPSDLVKHSLRNSPDRIILGEIRDAVAYDVLQAAMTGHKGTMSTIHADNAKKATERFATLAGSAGVINALEAKQMFATTFDLIIVVEKMVLRNPDGTTDVKRAISQITHIVGYGKQGAEKIGAKNIREDDQEVYFQDIYNFNKKTRKFVCTGYTPKDLINKAICEGITYDPKLFIKNNDLK